MITTSTSSTLKAFSTELTNKYALAKDPSNTRRARR